MPRILKMGVEWNAGYANPAELRVLVDQIPDLSEYRYECRDGIYYAEKDGFVSFMFYSQPGEGFGGKTFKLKMKDGSIAILKGPWSSNSSSVNSRGFGPCREIVATDDPEVWENGHTFFSGAMTLTAIREAVAELMPGLEIHEEASINDMDVYLIRYKGFTAEESKKSHELSLDMARFKDMMAREVFKKTVTETKRQGVCIDCGGAENRTKEWLISGLCDHCCDKATKVA